MKGAEGLIRTLLAGGVEVCFTNPGTSEMHIVAALDQLKDMRCVLGLFEGVVTGAADGYARMANKPACTLLHLGPGLANGVANLHNARRAEVPLVNLVGQHATYHLRHDTPLSSDIEGIAGSCSSWVRTASAASEVGNDAADAIVAARSAPGRIATLIVPEDVAWSEGGAVVETPLVDEPPIPADGMIERAAALLRSGLPTGILISGKALYGRGLAVAGRIAKATGAKLLAPYPFARMERGATAPRVERINYVLEQAVEQLKEFRQLLLVGARVPISYFAVPGKNTMLVSPECKTHTLARPREDYVGALEALEAALSLGKKQAHDRKLERPQMPVGPFS
ncbi:MAG TPA: acetolactate synthase large subunit, partial [Candidatus Dormibacteraeota bacterium]|nr:acetolactate synthase large subunit [Candidatus Dormibacteraeota bacterium]